MLTQHSVSFTAIGILLITSFLRGLPLILVKGFGGPIFWSNYSAFFGVGMEYHLQKVAFDFSIGYQSYNFSVPQDEIPPPFDTISYYGRHQELPIGLGVKYHIFHFKGFSMFIHPKIGVLLSGGEIRSEAKIPSELDNKYARNEFFLSVNPGIGICYSIPKTNLWLGTEINYSRHFNYAKEQNNYFALTYSLAFELFRR